MTLRIVILIALSFQVMLFSTRPIMSLYASHLGATTWEIGLLTAAFAFFPFVMAIHIGKIADYVGDRLPVIFGMAGLTVGVALPFLFPYLWSLYVSQAIIGVSQIFGIISLQNVIGNISTKENRDHQFGIYSTAVATGGLIGPVMGGYLAEYVSFPFAYFVATCIGILPICLSFFIPDLRNKKSPGTEPTGSPFQLLKIPLLRKALASSALVLYSRDIFVAYFPLFASQMGLSAKDIGWIITIQGLTMVIIRFSLSRLSGKFGRGRVLLGSIFVAGLSFLLVPLSDNAIVFGILSAFMGAGLGCGQPLSMTTTYNASPKDRTGEVLGLRLAINRLSQLAAPMLFGLIGSWAGIVSVFYVSGAFLIGGAFITKQTSDDFPENG
jgi:MFS family permease